ncbi:MAG: metalloregulator ArsR/SmtB family transcription factor [Planctomycetota bacterium]
MRRTVELFKALADETRLRILSLLSSGELCVCEMTKVLDIGQPKASRHLAVLRQAELVVDRREGMWMYYSLAEPRSETQRSIVAWLESVRRELPQAAADMDALKRLQRSGGLCGPLCAERRRAAPKDDVVATR